MLVTLKTVKNISLYTSILGDNLVMWHSKKLKCGFMI